MTNTIVEKVKGFLMAPTKTFKECKPESLGAAFRYYVVLLIIFTILYAIVSVIVGMVTYTDSLNQLAETGMLGSSIAELLQNLSGFIIALEIFFVYLFFLILLVGVFLDGLFYHVFVLLFGGQGFRETIKAMMYAATPWFLLGWIPYISIIGGIWAIVLFIIGVKEFHGMTLGRAILVFLVPFVLILILFALGGVVIAALVGGIMEMLPMVS